MAFDRAITTWVRWATHPPQWFRAWYVVVFALLVWSITEHRGWLTGLAAFFIYGALFVPMVAAPSRVIAWSHRNPQLDGAILGPVTFLALSGVTTVPLWVCLAVGVLGAIAGLLIGHRRQKRLSR